MKDEPTPLTHGEEWLKPIGVPDHVWFLVLLFGVVTVLEVLIIISVVVAHG